MSVKTDVSPFSSEAEQRTFNPWVGISKFPGGTTAVERQATAEKQDQKWTLNSDAKQNPETQLRKSIGLSTNFPKL